jgi:hypothetical protein
LHWYWRHQIDTVWFNFSHEVSHNWLTPHFHWCWTQLRSSKCFFLYLNETNMCSSQWNWKHTFRLSILECVSNLKPNINNWVDEFCFYHIYKYLTWYCTVKKTQQMWKEEEKNAIIVFCQLRYNWSSSDSYVLSCKA